MPASPRPRILATTTPENQMRRVQWELLNPELQPAEHPPEMNDPRLPWSLAPRVESNFRKYSGLRMRLSPYYNSLAYESRLTGLPVLRPPIVKSLNDTSLRCQGDQIMLGSCLMICPVVEPDATSRLIALPEGLWHDFCSRRSWQGSTVIEYPAPPDCMPILVRGGTILPMGSPARNEHDGRVFEKLELHIWSPYPAEGILFDDDGSSTAYERSAFSRTRLRAEDTGDHLLIRISGAQGRFTGQLEKRRVNIILRQPGFVESAFVNTEKIPVKYHSRGISISFEQNALKDDLVELKFRT
jgi:alpha-glucosidase (family GH31 glycosyl hydrolase)